MHAHRLEVLHPDLFARVQRLTDTDTGARAFASQVCVPLAIQMIDTVQMSADVETPAELRHMWDLLGTGDAISDDDWQDYLMASMVEYVNLSARRPGDDAGVAERERYHAQWVCARTMEFLRGWWHSPRARRHDLRDRGGVSGGLRRQVRTVVTDVRGQQPISAGPLSFLRAERTGFKPPSSR